jgi:hypothetical protein
MEKVSPELVKQADDPHTRVIIYQEKHQKENNK